MIAQLSTFVLQTFEIPVPGFFQPSKMLSLILIATFVLPSVLGHCCYPDKISAVAIVAGEKSAVDVLADFTQNKYIAMPRKGNVEFVLNDMNEGKSYTKFDDGSCTVGGIAKPFPKCVPESAQHIGTNHFVGSIVDAYTLSTGKDSGVLFVVNKDNCMPAVLIETFAGETHTSFFINATSSVSDVSALSQDVSGCQ